jgi:hypothetical protein
MQKDDPVHSSTPYYIHMEAVSEKNQTYTILNKGQNSLIQKLRCGVLSLLFPGYSPVFLPSVVSMSLLAVWADMALPLPT